MRAGVQRQVALWGAPRRCQSAAHLLAAKGRVAVRGRQVATIAAAIGCQAQKVPAMAPTTEPP